MAYKRAKQSDIEHVDLARQALLGAGAGAGSESILRSASNMLRHVLTEGETADYTAEALLVIIIQGLMDKYGSSKGDHALANEVSRYVGHESLRCDRNRVYRLRHKYRLEPGSQDAAAPVMEVMELPGSGHVRIPRSDTTERIIEDPLYVKRPADLVLEALAPEQGETIIVKAPRGFGATRLLERYTALCHRHGKRVAVIDLSLRGLMRAESYADVLATLAGLMRRKFGLEPIVNDESAIATQLDMTYFVEDRVLAEIGGPCTLVLERTDRFLGQPFKDDFFSMLRYWHNSRSAPGSPWRRVDLVLATSVDPMRFISDHTRSPFTVGRTLVLGLFDRQACAALNIRNGIGLSDEQVDELFQLTQGQPYLLWRAFKELRLGLPFASMVRNAAEREGPFREHLLQIEHALEHRHGLAHVYRDLVVDGVQPDTDHARELMEAGLVREVGDEVAPLCPIYSRYFADRLD